MGNRPTVQYSRRPVLNIKLATQGQAFDGVLAATDGTNKLHFGGWTLVNLGTYATRYVPGAYSKHYRPWLFMFVRTEHQLACRELHTTAKNFSQSLFGIDLKVAFGSLDHTSYIAAAFAAVWPEVLLLNCWPHFARKSREKACLLSETQYYDDVVYPHLKWVHEAKTKEQFEALVEICVAKWIEDGKDDYAAWCMWRIRGVHGTLVCWKCGGSSFPKTPRIIPSRKQEVGCRNTPCEYRTRFEQLSTRNFSNCKYGGGPIAYSPLWRSPIPAKYFVRARALLANKHNYLRLRRSISRDIRAVAFNDMDFAITTVNSTRGSTVTAARAKRVADSLLIEAVRDAYVCDCKERKQTGWVCEHVVAVLSLRNKLSLNDALQSLPVRRTHGRQPKTRGALVIDAADQHFFFQKRT